MVVSRALALAAALILPATGFSAEEEALIELNDGGFLRGKLLSIKEQSVHWNHLNSGVEMRFPASDVRRILFSNTLSTAPEGDIIFLRDGSSLPGHLESLDDKKARLSTQFAGHINISRPRIESIHIASGKNQSLLDAFKNFEAWNRKDAGGRPENWSMKDGILHFDGKNSESVEREFDLPPRLDLNFEISWNAQENRGYPRFGILIGHEPEENAEPTDHYNVNFSRTSVFFQRVGAQQNGRLTKRTLGAISLNSYIKGARQAKIRIIIDRPSKRVYFFINGKQAGSWTDSMDDIPQGGCVSFKGSRQSPIRLRRLRIGAWNGVLGDNGDSRSKPSKDTDRVITDDGDDLPGKILAVKSDAKGERTLEFTCPLLKESSVLKPSLEQVQKLLFAHQKPSRQTETKALTATLMLDDGSKLHGILEAADSQGIHFLFDRDNKVSLPVGSLLEIRLPSPEPAEENPEKETDKKGAA